MKPRVTSGIWYTLERNSGGLVKRVNPRRLWTVEFGESCCPDGEGCRGRQEFPNFQAALRFANHIAAGGDEWEFMS